MCTSQHRISTNTAQQRMDNASQLHWCSTPFVCLSQCYLFFLRYECKEMLPKISDPVSLFLPSMYFASTLHTRRVSYENSIDVYVYSFHKIYIKYYRFQILVTKFYKNSKISVVPNLYLSC